MSAGTFTTGVLGLAVLGTATASAQVVQIQQRFILSEPLIAPISAVDLFANVDLSTITGVGSETAVITGASVRIFNRPDTSSSFQLIDAGDLILPSDPFADVPLNMRAEFVDGVFTDAVRIVPDPLITNINFLSIRENNSGGFLFVDASDVIYGPTIISTRRYTLESSLITPTPGTSGVLAFGGWVASRRRRGRSNRR